MPQADISIHTTKPLDSAFNWTVLFKNDDYSRVTVWKWAREPHAALLILQCGPRSNFRNTKEVRNWKSNYFIRVGKQLFQKHVILTTFQSYWPEGVCRCNLGSSTRKWL
jgi:hypothetical protein